MINSDWGSASANGVQSTNKTNTNVGLTVKMSIKMYYLNAHKQRHPSALFAPKEQKM